MMGMLLAVVTISDRCSQGLLEDTAGPAVVELLRAEWPQAEIRKDLLADDQDAIAALLEELSVRGAALAEAMRSLGAASNPYAWLSRGVVGLKGSTLIVNLPGSLRGATESLSSILPLVRHALEIASGGQRHP